MHKQNLRRLIIGVVAIVVIFFGWSMFRNYAKDPGDVGTVDSEGWVLAVEDTDEGYRTVVFNPDGAKTTLSGSADQEDDIEATWRPDGNKVMLISNREGGSFSVYRWQPDTQDAELRMPRGTRNAAGLWYPQSGDALQNDGGIVIVSGLVHRIDQRTQKLTQILPPPSMNRGGAQEEGASGMSGAMSGVYATLGTSFSAANWAGSDQALYAVMRREEGGFLLIYNRLGTDTSGMPFPPVQLAAGDRIDLDVLPNGVAAVAIEGYKWPDPNDPRIPEQFKKDGELTVPFENVMFIARPTAEGAPPNMTVAFSASNDQVLRHPAFAPDGTAIIGSAGTLKEGQFKSDALIIFPPEEGGVQKAQPIVPGPAEMPAWHPNGKMIVYVGKDDQGRGRLFTINFATQTRKPLGEPGRFTNPMFSPKTDERAGTVPNPPTPAPQP